MANSKLMSNAKNRKDDEYFTLYDDVANEIPKYKEQLRGKRIICPCDWDESFDTVLVYKEENYVTSETLFNTGNYVKKIDVSESKKKLERDLQTVKCNFVKFLVAHAEDYGIKSISVCGYNPETGNGVKFQNINYKNYDVVITNPPFSQIIEFFDIMIKNNMLFLVIGPLTAIGYKDAFKYIKENKMWLGYAKQLIGFARPDGTQLLSKNPDGSVPRACKWYTNLDVTYRHDELILTNQYDPNQYPSYFNFDGIEVGDIRDIPDDFDGYMGVPISFLQKYNPEQFEIVDLGSSIPKKYKHTTDGDYIHYIDEKTGEKKYTFPYTVKERKIGNGLRIERNGTPSESPFGRIIIRNKKVHHDEN